MSETTFPDSIKNVLLEEHGISISRVQPVSGGSINHAVKLGTNRGNFFLKWNSGVPAGFFEKEAEGLRLLRLAKSLLRIPEVAVTGKPAANRPEFLLLEYIEEGRGGDFFTFGTELAKLHQTAADQFGLDADNYIGSLPQSNIQHDDWARFFAGERITPQLKMAVDSGRIDVHILSHWERLAAKLETIFPPCSPSLLHGDLWGGNYLFDEKGAAVLIDPAVYYGHPEMDLAFTKMFGGFSGAFYAGYESIAPLEAGFASRVPVYNLYPLLVHVNLFGGHYTSQCIRFLKQF